MGDLIQGPWPEFNQQSGVSNATGQSTDSNTFVSQLQGLASSISIALQAAMEATACFQRFDVWPDQCKGVQQYLQLLLDQVTSLLQVIKSTAYVSICYPVLIQGNHVSTLLDDLIDAVGKVARSRGNADLYRGAWTTAYQKIEGYPSEVTNLVTRISQCCSEIVRNALS